MINAVNMSKLHSPQDPSWVTITADDGTELLAILHDGTVRGTIENAGPAAQQFVTALRGLTEAIATQAQAEALREAADAVDDDQYDALDPYVAEWLRVRADQAEFLAKAIADPEGRRLANAAAALATPGLGNWPATMEGN